MKIVSWNVNSLNVRQPHLEEWLKLREPDVVCLQETKLQDDKFPDDALLDLGYRSIFTGQKTYNGVAILSKHKIVDPLTDVPGFEDEQRRVIAATVNGIRIINLYVVNGQDVDTDKYDYKLRWLKAITEWIADEKAQHEKIVINGDFNIAPDERDVYDAEAWNDDHILTSTAERGALQAMLDLGFHDAFRLVNQDAGQFSWWDYRAAAYRRNMGLRIDLNLVSDALKDAVKDAGIDREPRDWERPSDHAPAWVELDD